MNAAPPSMRFETEEVDDITVVIFADSKIVDDRVFQIIGEQLMELCDGSIQTKVIVDFKNVVDLSSAFLGKLMVFQRKLAETNRRMIICGSEQVAEPFSATRLDKSFTIAKTRQDAIEAFMN